MKRAVGGLVAALVVSAPAARADAPASPHIELHVDACAPVDASDTRRIVAIELRATVTDPAVHDPATTRVAVSCVERLVELEVTDPLTGKSLARRIALVDQPNASRSRLLALAIAELVAASWSELETNPTPAVPPASIAAPPEEREAARQSVVALVPPSIQTGVARPDAASATAERARDTVRIATVLAARWFVVGSDPLVGVGARGVLDLASGPELAVDALGEAATVATRLGTIAVQSWSLGASMSARRRIGQLTLHAGAGARIGVAHFTGEPSSRNAASGSSLSALWGAPCLVGGARVDLGARFALSLDAELGYVTLPVRADAAGGPDARVEGAMLAATAGGVVSF